MASTLRWPCLRRAAPSRCAPSGAGACSKPQLKKLGLREQESFLQENQSLTGTQAERCLKCATVRSLGPTVAQ